MAAWIILRNWLLFGVGMGCVSGLQVYLATEKARRGLAMVGVGLALGLAGGIGRLVVEWRRGGLGEVQVGSVHEWSRRRVPVAVLVIALVIGAAFARTGDEPLLVYVAFLLLAGVIVLLDRVERYMRGVAP